MVSAPGLVPGVGRRVSDSGLLWNLDPKFYIFSIVEKVVSTIFRLIVTVLSHPFDKLKTYFKKGF